MIFYIADVQEKIGYEFKDAELLRRCFTHPSYTNQHDDEKNYERIEFLGDSVLGFVVADFVFRNAKKDEGGMTEDKQNIVSSKPLSQATKRLGVEKYMLKHEKVKITDSMCENLFEALIGGIYLDGGLEEAKKFIEKNLIKPFYKKGSVSVKDNKSKLNEFVSKNHLGNVEYVLVSKKGKDNLPTFQVKAVLDSKEISRGTGSSKKNAEQMAAKNALAILEKGV